MKTKPTIFCLIPTKNEEWIIERALKSASIWADKIIVSDQGSTDRTVEIAKQFPKVTLIDNSALKEFNEKDMRMPLFNEARKTPGKRLLISLDADEIFTPNFDSPEWDTMLCAEEGTRFVFNWRHLLPGCESYFSTIQLVTGFMDDGGEYDAGLIHTARQPRPQTLCPTIYLNDISILHFQFTNWERMQRKHLWYQMYERKFFPKRSVARIFRSLNYNIDAIATKQSAAPQWWLDAYKKLGIDITSVFHASSYQWDATILQYLYEADKPIYNKIDIWGEDWVEIAKRHGYADLNKFVCSQSFIDKLILRYLRRSHVSRDKLIVRAVDKVLRFFV